jgi:hypothetical protein
VSTTQGDVWSLGVVLWEIWTYACLPYSSHTNQEVMEGVPSGLRLDQPLSCPDGLYRLMKECWQQEPLHRPPFKSLAADLRDIAERLLNSPHDIDLRCSVDTSGSQKQAFSSDGQGSSVDTDSSNERAELTRVFIPDPAFGAGDTLVEFPSLRYAAMNIGIAGPALADLTPHGTITPSTRPTPRPVHVQQHVRPSTDEPRMSELL